MDGQSMWALRAHRRGGPEQLVFEEAPRPPLTRGEVLVSVRAAAITFDELLWDESWQHRDGSDRTPVIPSHEWSGVVLEAPPDSPFSAGDGVFGMVPFDRDGAAAEVAAVPVWAMAPKPPGLGDLEAAALPLAGLTAWQALVEHAHVSAGDEVLVLGAAGGVGSLTAQLARELGCTVTALSRERDATFVADLGVDHVLTDPDQVPELAAKLPFDLVVDCVGGELMDIAIDATREGGCFVTLQQPPPKRVAERGVRGVFFIVTPKADQMQALAALVEQRRLRVPVAATYPLAEGAQAYASQKEQPRRPGKTVLLIAD